MPPDVRREIVSLARSYRGTPYCHRGSTDHSVDCYGLLGRVADTCEALQPLPPLNYSAEFTGNFFANNFFQIFESRGRNFREEGSVVALKQRGSPCHLGILTLKHGVWHMVHTKIERLLHGKVMEEPIGKPFFYERNILDVADFKLAPQEES